MILQEKPDITASELANRLSMSLGEALVILHELEEERKSSA
jgi:DNA-binding Lrp family transcriptional regulator